MASWTSIGLAAGRVWPDRQLAGIDPNKLITTVVADATNKINAASAFAR